MPADKLHEWEAKWARTDYNPTWIVDEAPEELKRTIARGDFPRPARLLDIGCGNGAISAWLARQGYSVLGIDFARAAIKRASERFGDVPGLTFAVVDACDADADIGTFDGLFDRGCLHTLTSRQAAKRYAASVARWSKPNAPFLLIHKTLPRRGATVSSRQNLARTMIDRLFKPWFRLADAQATFVACAQGDHSERQMPALAVWMARRDEACAPPTR